MAKFRGAIVVDIERCKGCGVCITACPCKVIEQLRIYGQSRSLHRLRELRHHLPRRRHQGLQKSPVIQPIV